MNVFGFSGTILHSSPNFESPFSLAHTEFHSIEFKLMFLLHPDDKGSRSKRARPMLRP